MQYNNDTAFLCAEITAKLVIEGSAHKVWPEGLRRLKPSLPSAAHSEKQPPRTPLVDLTNTRSDEQFTAYTAQKRRAAASARLADQHGAPETTPFKPLPRRSNEQTAKGAITCVAAQKHIFYASYRCLLIMKINHYHHPG
jgi:hypothetical protein